MSQKKQSLHVFDLGWAKLKGKHIKEYVFFVWTAFISTSICTGSEMN